MALDALVQAHIRAITPPDRMADRYESLSASTEATAAISAMLDLKAALGKMSSERTPAQNATESTAADGIPVLRTRQEPDHPMR